ncbi:hypothetical protein ALC56_07558 [Trachymyrmex septentrionalis]|uniref:Uncharacterized protein n=1 Tax=Trachymyrmex septentrionalis TaxID=34720 RepID=A0A151JVU3_9HYME|nr:hypothetical protein ALC56_07558 [Trachymyrmex septentrionalis]
MDLIRLQQCRGVRRDDAYRLVGRFLGNHHETSVLIVTASIVTAVFCSRGTRFVNVFRQQLFLLSKFFSFQYDVCFISHILAYLRRLDIRCGRYCLSYWTVQSRSRHLIRRAEGAGGWIEGASEPGV